MKIIFLDIDGVLNILYGEKRRKWKGRIGAHEDLVKNFCTLLDKDKDIQVVISSSHRVHGMVKVLEYLEEGGMEKIYASRFRGSIAPPSNEKSRGELCLEYLKERGLTNPFVMIDDGFCIGDVEVIPSVQRIKVDNYQGLTKEDIEEILRKLKLQEELCYLQSTEKK